MITLNEEIIIELILKSFEKQFPKKCGCCGKEFENYAHFVSKTNQLADPISYDKDFLEGGMKRNFLGVVKYHNCDCGNTLAVLSKDDNPFKMLRIMLWVRHEHKRTGRSYEEMLRYYDRKVKELLLLD